MSSNGPEAHRWSACVLYCDQFPLLPSPKLFWLWFSNLFLLCVRSMFYHQLPRGGSHRNRRALIPEPQQQQQWMVQESLYKTRATITKWYSVTTPTPSLSIPSTESRSVGLWSHINWLSRRCSYRDDKFGYCPYTGGSGVGQAMKPFG